MISFSAEWFPPPLRCIVGGIHCRGTEAKQLSAKVARLKEDLEDARATGRRAVESLKAVQRESYDMKKARDEDRAGVRVVASLLIKQRAI